LDGGEIPSSMFDRTTPRHRSAVYERLEFALLRALVVLWRWLDEGHLARKDVILST
jgi:hypothetical protein